MFRKKSLLILVLFFFCLGTIYAQQNSAAFRITGNTPVTVDISRTFTVSGEIIPEITAGTRIYGLGLRASASLSSDDGIIRVFLTDRNFREYLVYETYSLLQEGAVTTIEGTAEETCVLNGIEARSLRIEISDAELQLHSLVVTTEKDPNLSPDKVKQEKRNGQREEKIRLLNKNLRAKGMNWVAGPTEVADLSYEERKKLYGDGTFPPGFEYYSGGVITVGVPVKSAETGVMTTSWDWRDRHGKNWITPVVNQGGCGSCWAFAAAGATEAMVNLFFNQLVHLDLSEQDLLSCSGAGTCGGGNPGRALDYITSTGVVDEAAFPYSGTDETCAGKSTTPAQLIRIGGRIDFGSTLYPRTVDDLKRMLIREGPVSGGLYDWSHAMVLVGYKVVEAGDKFYYRDLNLSRYWKTVADDDPLIGTTVWIFKNSWGSSFGDGGYIYVETPVSNFGWTHSLKSPVTSVVNPLDVVCEDADGDGYFWWGIGPKPASCAGPDQPDGNDADPTLGPLDEYGNCVPLIAAPVAAFTADHTEITAGGSVNFTDLSTHHPTAWAWTFEGGIPATSDVQHPVVNYPDSGRFSVSLTVSNTGGSDTKNLSGYIHVTTVTPDPEPEPEPVPVITYCTSEGNPSAAWIAAVQVGGRVNTSGAEGYGDFTATEIPLISGAVMNLSLTPGFAGKNQFETWRVWIDYNGDGDFSDDGEQVYAVSKQRAGVNTSIAIPSGVSRITRMRVAMAESTASECGPVGAGEVEDYTVAISETAPGPDPEPDPEPATDYCLPINISSTNDYIKQVMIGDRLNLTSGGDGYSMAGQLVSLSAGQRYSLTLSPLVSTNRNFWNLWIDFNGDKDFDDIGETLLAANNKRGTFTSVIDIPLSATGTTRMRIAMKTGGSPGMCEDGFSGEVEDYDITFDVAAGKLKSAIAENPDMSNSFGFSVYPNPVAGEFHVAVNQVYPGDRYKLYSASGEIQLEGMLSGAVTTIATNRFVPGVYILVVVNEQNVYQKKILKK